jgi:enamine deaminase RidA (YjgF/YER057c/UK114 family)
LLSTRSRRILNVDSPEATLRTLGIELPEPPKALASYIPVQQVGELLYTSGVIPSWNGEVQFRGVVGAEVSLKDAARAAEICALNIMSLIRQHAGSLDQVEQFVQLSGFVRSATGFGEQPKVLNGASDLIFKIFGERGRHTRQALGTSELPLGVPVEISAIVRLKP